MGDWLSVDHWDSKDDRAHCYMKSWSITNIYSQGLVDEHPNVGRFWSRLCDVNSWVQGHLIHSQMSGLPRCASNTAPELSDLLAEEIPFMDIPASMAPVG